VLHVSRQVRARRSLQERGEFCSDCGCARGECLERRRSPAASFGEAPEGLRNARSIGRVHLPEADCPTAFA
jgi:hypothetical protein